MRDFTANRYWKQKKKIEEKGTRSRKRLLENWANKQLSKSQRQSFSIKRFKSIEEIWNQKIHSWFKRKKNCKNKLFSLNMISFHCQINRFLNVSWSLIKNSIPFAINLDFFGSRKEKEQKFSLLDWAEFKWSSKKNDPYARVWSLFLLSAFLLL